MKKTSLLLMTIAPAMAMCESESVHSLSPKMFFKHHEEGKEKFTELGLGFEYKIGKEKGLNFRFSHASNLDNLGLLSLLDMEFSWKMCTSPNFQIYPFLGVSSFYHTIESNDKYTLFSQKSNADFGFGFKLNPNKRFQPFIQVGLLKDMGNTLTQIEDQEFVGATYSNPWGAKIKLGIESEFTNNNSVSLNGYYSESSHKCYRSYGSELAFNWRF